jgi:hypothetical protein
MCEEIYLAVSRGIGTDGKRFETATNLSDE